MTAVPPIKSPKKLIEVALPLNAINAAAAREKSIRHGHPSTLHLWWARRPLAAARAVIFAQLVNDPGFQQGAGFKYGRNKKDAAVERKRLFKILEELVKWESTTDDGVLDAARVEIWRSWREVCDLNKDHPQAKDLFDPHRLPGLHDPFAGGGTIPLEAQRLGLEAFATDLNPVAVLINKAMIEIPPRFMGLPPVHPEAMRSAGLSTWKGVQGLAEDVRRYGAWIRETSKERIGALYPKVEVTSAMAAARPDLAGFVGQKLQVVAWLWVRTVRSPNPAFANVEVPLASNFLLSSKDERECWVEPVIADGSYHFQVHVGKAPEGAADGTKASGRGAAFRCVMSATPISGDYVKEEGRAGRIGAKLMAMVAESGRGRVYLSPMDSQESEANSAVYSWRPDLEFAHNSRHMTPWVYGLSNFGTLFTARQLVALTHFSDLVGEAREHVRRAAVAAGWDDDGIALSAGGKGATGYGDAVAVYLAFAVSKAVDRNSALCVWETQMGRMRGTFGRQALPMVWDFVETNPLAGAAGDISGTAQSVSEVLDKFVEGPVGVATQADAQSQSVSLAKFVSTDPPYYDNVPYADLSDFFYIWLRRSLKPVYPELFATIAVPKNEELVADSFRHASKGSAETFFLEGMTAAMRALAEQAHPASPVTIYYAFKQSETKAGAGTSSPGWQTFLEAVLRAGFALTGTWPMRTELGSRMRSSDSNALASSIILVCRRRLAGAPTVSRREFIRDLNTVLPEALDEMTKGVGDEQSPVAPVDLSQAIIGPGMAVFSKYTAVLEADGTPMSVKTALQLINRFLAEDDFDHDTQFCLHWFDQHGWGDGAYGEADVLARAKATAVSGLADAGVLKSGAGKVRLLRPNEYPSDWDPKKDSRIPIWEALHQLIRAIREDGESGAGLLLTAVKPKSEAIRQLAYRLYTLCERRGWADDARAYNELITSWAGIEAAANAAPNEPAQGKLFD